MQWVTAIWSMAAAACLTLAGVHLLVWFKLPRTWGHLLFASSATCAAILAFFELGMMTAESPDAFGRPLRFYPLPLSFMILSLVCFVRVHLRAGRPWLAWAVVAGRALTVILNLAFTPNINYRQITGIHRITFLGGQSVSVVHGVTSSWTLVGQITGMLLVIFVVDAFVTLWRRGDRHGAVVICGSMAVSLALALVHTALVLWDVIQFPFGISIFYLGIIAAMAYELSSDVAGAAQLGRRLQAKETELRESEDRVELATQWTDVVIWEWDMAADSIRMSDGGMALFGLDRSEPITFDRFMRVIHPDDRAEKLHAVANAMDGRGDYEVESRVVSPDRGVRWISGHGRIHFDAAGRAVSLRGVFIDVTSRKEAELEVQQQRSELAHLSRVSMLGELSGSLAHELNQPLAAILSNAQAAQRFLAHQPVDLDEVRAILSDIVHDDNRAGEVIRRLRLLLTKGELQQQELDLNEVIREVLRLLNSDLLNHNVSVQTQFDDDLPTVRADRIQIQQVLLNLIINGCDAMASAGAADRRLQLRTASANGSGAQVCVADRGCGIPPDRLEQIFEPFYSTKKQGMGLGLAVCRTIISAHGGRLWAMNNPDGGASFHILLPSSVPAGTVK